MQATARVLDTRDSWSGLRSARDMAARLATGEQFSATVETSLTRISVDLAARQEATLDRPRNVRVTINYLRN